MIPKDITQIKWYFWHVRERSLFHMYIINNGSCHNSMPGYKPLATTMGIILNNLVTKESDVKAARSKVWKNFKKDNTHILNELDRAYLKGKRDMDYWQKLLYTDFSSFDNQGLIGEYKKYLQGLLEYGPYMYFPLVVEPLLTEEVKRLLEDLPECYDTVMEPLKDSDITEECKSLLEIAIKKKKGKDVSKDLEKHTAEFAFLKSKGYFLDLFDEEHYAKQIEDIKNPEKKLMEIESNSYKKQERFEKLLERFKDDSYARALFRTTNEAVYFRTWRTNKLDQSSYYAMPLFREITKRISIDDVHDLVFLLPSEVISLLEWESKLDYNIIKERKKGYIYLVFGKDELMLQGKDALAYQGKFEFMKVSDKNLTGSPAFRGKELGITVVVHGKQDYAKIKAGTILVAHSTLPEMVPYIRNVKAIVVEEGGILSHASVISREMKIPGIIGVKGATYVLKDGDFVEVDADKGIVRKIK